MTAHFVRGKGSLPKDRACTLEILWVLPGLSARLLWASQSISAHDVAGLVNLQRRTGRRALSPALPTHLDSHLLTHFIFPRTDSCRRPPQPFY
ncbi:hypothetical protein BDZ90DRAFT_242959 [Jaminaea rosea]|uniref:Uncharacterized protein n=1 Tax=Jaminaea rosea TaxID=1569628 RepID=A0A316UJN0_9BASI|nr:hypothetical protein BDZ90DRAFT_242959 [Jaminaea rosea]PWN25487.1 hypothetical protein BDZ90DRAFT_242959 [Jaminaea rosea]